MTPPTRRAFIFGLLSDLIQFFAVICAVSLGLQLILWAAPLCGQYHLAGAGWMMVAVGVVGFLYLCRCRTKPFDHSVTQAVLDRVIAANLGMFLTTAVEHLEKGGNFASCETELTNGTKVEVRIIRIKPPDETVSSPA